jgi:hypothetical protein
MAKPPGRPIVQRIAVAQRRARLLELKATGWSHQRIVDEGDLGYRDKAHVSKDLARTLALHQADTQLGADTLRTLELAKLDEQEAILWQIVRRPHPLVSGGRVVTVELPGADGQPPRSRTLSDDGPTMAALDRLLRLGQQRARLLGLEAPVRLDAGGTVAFTFPGVDMAKAFPPATEGSA